MTAAPDDSDLAELLRKCHRDELVPLARALGVNPSMPRANLARAIDAKLRRAAAHELLNLLLRRGHGPPYAEVLSAEVRRAGLTTDGGPAAMEDRLLASELAARWEQLPDAERERRWQRAAGEAPTPPTGAAAIQALAARLGDRWSLVAHAELAARVLPGPLGCVPVLIALRPRRDLVRAALLEVARLRRAVRYRVTVGVVGSPSSGKDAALAAVFGVDTGNIDPVAGSTRTVEIVKIASAAGVYLVNTPGLGDVVQAVTEEARQILDHIDVYLYVVNAQGGVQAREKADYAACVATGRPVLAVINKIDTLKPEDRERYLADAQQKLGAADDAFVAVAFDPLPQLAPGPIGVEAVRAWLERRLSERGKEPADLPWRSVDVRRPAELVELEQQQPR